MSELDQALARQRQDLDRLERATVRDLRRAYQVIERRLAADIDKLAKEIAADPSPSVRFRRDRAEALLSQIKAELHRYATDTLGPAVQQSKGTAATLAQDHAARLLRDGLGPPPAGVELAFARLPVQAIETIVGTTRAGPLADLLATFGDVAAARARQALTTGLALGYHPTKIARLLKDALGTTQQRALLIARTETLRAHREASRATYRANSHLVTGWAWRAACDERTCAACWALHGRVYPLDEPMAAHPACRCSLVPVTKTWAQLGYPDVPETRDRTPDGASLFAQAPAATKQAVLGPAAYDAYTQGEVSLTDFIKVRQSPTWGMSYTRASLRDARLHHR